MYKQIEYNHKKISYKVSGNGPCILFIHGFTEDHTMWKEFAKPFERDYRILCLDIPGFGGSEVIEDFSVEMMAVILKEILEIERIENCYLVGHSMGGYVALAFAEQYETILKGLCLFHSHHYADTEEKKQNRAKTITFMEKWGSAAFVKELVPKLFSAKFVADNPDFMKGFIENASTYPKEGLIAATQAMIERPDRSAVLQQLSCPVLFIIGVQDEAIPTTFSEAQMQLPKKARALILDSVAHMGMYEAPVVTQIAVENWLEEK